ncbi:hypothetical protein BDZ97DRAFT_2080316, partial [Flammula alnicola]
MPPPLSGFKMHLTTQISLALVSTVLVAATPALAQRDIIADFRRQFGLPASSCASQLMCCNSVALVNLDSSSLSLNLGINDVRSLTSTTYFFSTTKRLQIPQPLKSSAFLESGLGVDTQSA